MGAKFFRSADKPKKIRKRVTQTRSWFRTFKWTSYHAHPLMICGHPFKGGSVFSTGYLQHPDMKRFGINDSTFFQPPRPTACLMLSVLLLPPLLHSHHSVNSSELTSK